MVAADPPQLGKLLKDRRQECGLSLEELAARTRIRRTYLQALEEDRFEVIPGEAYRTGFLRIYAGVVGFPADEVIRRYREQAAASAAVEDDPVSLDLLATGQRRWKPLTGPLPWLAVGLLIVFAVSLISLRKATLPPAPLSATHLSAQNLPEAMPPAAFVAPIEPQEMSAAAVTAAARPEPLSPVPAVAPVAAEDPPMVSPLIIDFPGVALLRLESLGPNRIEFRCDNRPTQAYNLTATAVLSWKVKQNGHLTVADPAAVRLWLDQQPLDFDGRREVILQNIQVAGSTDSLRR